MTTSTFPKVTGILVFPDQSGNSGKFLTTDGTTLSWGTALTSVSWGSITGTLSNQTDLQTAIDAKVSDTAYNASSWDSVTTVAPSKNSVRDQIETMLTSISGKFAYDSVAIAGDTNLVAGKFYNVDASGGIYSGALPVAVINTFVGICDPTGSFATNKFGVSSAGGKINGLTGSTYYIFAPFFSGIFYCYNGTDWILI